MNRRQQNRALKDWGELKKLVAALDPLVAPVLARGTFDSGERRDVKFEPSEKFRRDPEDGTQRPSYDDETGETAIRREVADRVERAVQAIVHNVGLSLSFAKWILEKVPDTNDEALRRAIPDCDGCGQPIFGRVISGYDRECYDRKRYLKIADRSEFRRVRRAEVEAKAEDG